MHEFLTVSVGAATVPTVKQIDFYCFSSHTLDALEELLGFRTILGALKNLT